MASAVLTAEEVKNRILDGGLADLIELKAERKGNSVYIPELKISITPNVHEVRENFVNIVFSIWSDEWETELTEVSVGAGNDTESALGMALGMFAYSFMNGLKNVAENRPAGNVTSYFAGNEHKWTVYASNITGAGNGKPDEVSEYWELIGKDIVRRLGNQKITYVKVYTSRNGSNVICECRINDVPVPVLSKKLETVTEKWNVDGFVSEKQFFFIIQDDDTLRKYRYAGKEGREKLYNAVAEYMKLYGKVNSEEEFMSIVDDTAKITGDRTLAEECHCFIPEICAERVYADFLHIGDGMILLRPDDQAAEAFRSQLSDYMPLQEAVFRAFNSGVLGDRHKTDEVFSSFVSQSSLKNVVDQAREQDATVEGLAVQQIIYHVDVDFELR
ncbi:MAG: hypothetical protein J6W65_04380 [Oscillospiraceae bacterium]|nr:hypothetical protein [Oscillospiraceae bacterium]MBQ5336657.1 hypothetical protein [Oscillospiraceae bacterium]